MLLERALGVVADMKAARVQADAAVWNALINAAGHAGQLQRAFTMVEDMLGHSSKPNARTYASLVDACARCGDKELALRVYRKALREGCGSALQVGLGGGGARVYVQAAAARRSRWGFWAWGVWVVWVRMSRWLRLGAADGEFGLGVCGWYGRVCPGGCRSVTGWGARRGLCGRRVRRFCGSALWFQDGACGRRGWRAGKQRHAG